jgi:hypothetical protein
MVYYNCKTGNKQTTKSDKTHARKLIKQKINLKREIQIMPQPQLVIYHNSNKRRLGKMATRNLSICQGYPKNNEKICCDSNI